MDQSFLQEFVLESAAALRRVEQDLLALEKTADLAAVTRVFRALHSIKGSSTFLQLTNISQLGHQVETLLDLVRQQHRPLTPEIIDVLLRSVDLFNTMIAAPDVGASTDIKPLMSVIQPLIAGAPPPARIPLPVAAVATALTNSPTLPESSTLRIDDASVAPAPVEAPAVPTAAPTAALTASPVDVQPGAAVESRAANEKPTADAGTLAGDGAEKMMRVRVRFLDDLLQLTGNMVMARNQLLSKYSFGDDPAFLTLSQCVTQVHKTIVQTRMLPIGALFDRGERQVRDLCRQLNKEVTLEVSGRELELDRSAIDAFGDPLTHLLRNALDHGMEGRDARAKAGKPLVGHLRLSALEHAGEVILTVEDDGRGIDPEFVRQRAIDKGLLSAESAAALSQRAALDLIFHPGFSTRDDVTSLSGRGVGLDVVRAKLRDFGGVVEVQSTPGKGTAFLARLPLTQALVHSSLISALIVACGDERYAIPQTAVDEIIKVGAGNDRLSVLNGQLVYQLRELVLPVVHLERVMRADSPPHALERAHVVVVIAFRNRLFGLLVDAVHGIEEIVVRPLPELVKHCKAFSGHTVMGDGRVALLLDGAGIIESERLEFADETVPHLMSAADREPVEQPQRLVVFSYADNEQFAIPLEMVSLIEKIPLSSVQQIGSQEFVQVARRTLPLMRLDKVMPVGALPPLTHAYLLIPARVSYPIAILAGRNVRVVDVVENYEAQLSDGQGILGTFIRQGKLIVLLDLFKLFERHSPERFKLKAIDQRPTEILLAEDSPFFQNLFRSYLDYPPRKITVAPDGQAAWDLLQAHPDRFELVVSDIEMPRLDGWGLIKRVRADSRFRDLPVVALTSMASPEHIARGLREGFNSYLVKIEKETLVKTVDRYLNGAKKKG